MTPRYFVWESSLLGPVARIWHGIQCDGSGKKQFTYKEPVELNDNDERSIEELKKDYPL